MYRVSQKRRTFLKIENIYNQFSDEREGKIKENIYFKYIPMQWGIFYGYGKPCIIGINHIDFPSRLDQLDSRGPSDGSALPAHPRRPR